MASIGQSPRITRAGTRQAILPWIGPVYLLALAFLGGASRSDEWRTLVLRVIACAVVLVITWRSWRAGRGIAAPTLGFWLAVAGLALAYLLPLPHGLWSVMPGRGEIAALYAAAGIGEVWRPLAISPALATNFIGALLPAVAAAMVFGTLKPEHQADAPRTIIAFALLSTLWSFLQAISQADPLWLYDITNEGRMTGLFSNRNHQAVLAAVAVPLCLREILSPTKEGARHAPLYALAILVFAAGALLNGSRAGVVTFGVAALGCLAIVWRFGSPEGRRIGGLRLLVPLVALAAISLGLLVLAQYSEGVSRLFDTDPLQEQRGQLLPVLAELVGKYFPLGAGPGGFELAFYTVETDAMLSPTYLNEAHNEPAQLLVELGIFALPVVAWPLVSIWRATRERWASSASIGRARMACLLLSLTLIGVASFVDYPLRTASMLAVFTLLWCVLTRTANANRTLSVR